jgi:hypothetical protein
VCAAWCQQHELSADVQQLHTPDTWCVILSVASDILWALTGRRWRNMQATETVTLDHPDRSCPPAPAWWGYGYDPGRWPLMWDPAHPKRIRLPRPDVTAVDTVTVDGDLFAAWRLAGNWLHRTDRAGWPTGPDRTVVAYQFGTLVPPSGRLACITLAAELGKAWAGKGCQLPARVSNVTRQGISFDVLENLEFLKENLTGLPGVDMWIRAVNPAKRAQSGRVWSPDIVEARTV